MKTTMTPWAFRAVSSLGLVVGLACAGPSRGEAPRADHGADACVGIPEEDRRPSPFEPPYTIESIAPVHRYLWTGRGSQRRALPGTGRMTGMLVTLHTPRRMTVDELETRLQCHIIWMRSSGDGTPAVRACPLAVPGASAVVRMGYGERFIIAISSKDERSAKEVWRRATALVGTREGASDGEEK